jgi:hypothetical protein
VSVQQQQVAEVRPIYRRGDRVLVKLPFGYCEVVIQGYEMRRGTLWLYGRGPGSLVAFPMKKVRYRPSPYHVLGWPESA